MVRECRVSHSYISPHYHLIHHGRPRYNRQQAQTETMTGNDAAATVAVADGTVYLALGGDSYQDISTESYVECLANNTFVFSNFSNIATNTISRCMYDWVCNL
jgi:ABC-type phosphate/phosphonate transport system substrate-binding protein